MWAMNLRWAFSYSTTLTPKKIEYLVTFCRPKFVKQTVIINNFLCSGVWKNSYPDLLLNNLSVAQRQLLSLRRNLEKDRNLKARYIKVIDSYLSNDLDKGCLKKKISKIKNICFATRFFILTNLTKSCLKKKISKIKNICFATRFFILTNLTKSAYYLASLLPTKEFPLTVLL